MCGALTSAWLESIQFSHAAVLHFPKVMTNFLFVFHHIFNGELQTGVNDNISSHIDQMHNISAWLKRADAARNMLASSL